jgi:hypothetical protein
MLLNFSKLQGKLSQKVYGSNHGGLAIPTEVLHGISQSRQTNGGIDITQFRAVSRLDELCS